MENLFGLLIIEDFTVREGEALRQPSGIHVSPPAEIFQQPLEDGLKGNGF